MTQCTVCNSAFKGIIEKNQKYTHLLSFRRSDSIQNAVTMHKMTTSMLCGSGGSTGADCDPRTMLSKLNAEFSFNLKCCYSIAASGSTHYKRSVDNAC
jgi:hypothetical protein